MGGIGLMSFSSAMDVASVWLTMYTEKHILNKYDELHLILTCRQSKVQMAYLNFHICHLNLGHITTLYKDIVKRKAIFFIKKKLIFEEHIFIME
jgi:hypothetical protein